MYNKQFLSFLFFFISVTTVNAKMLSNTHKYQAFYASSYGKLAFDEVIIKKSIRGNEFLSNIFEDNNLGFDNLIALSQVSDSIFNERKIKAGNTYALVYKQNNQNEINASKFIYEKNRVDYIIATLGKQFSVTLNKKHVEVIEKTATGIIESSLYVTMQANNTNPLLAVSLSEIYAWTIDFYKIQKGDKFKIIYGDALYHSLSIRLQKRSSNKSIR